MVTREDKQEFYNSREWRDLRYKVLLKYNRRCLCCGITANKKSIHVDHIKPISKYWNLRLHEDNLQTLCEDCNIAKSNTDGTDFRKKANNDNKRKALMDKKWDGKCFRMGERLFVHYYDGKEALCKMKFSEKRLRKKGNIVDYNESFKVCLLCLAVFKNNGVVGVGMNGKFKHSMKIYQELKNKEFTTN